jgi:CBS domain-containing protein
MVQTLRDIMTTDVKTVSKNDDICTAALKMKENNVGIIPVIDEQENCIGLVTDRDIVIRGLAEKRTASVKVEEVISKDVIQAAPDTEVKQAAEMMAKEQIRRLPVVEKGKLVGIVSMADLAVNRSTQEEAGHAIRGVSKPTEKHSQGQ